MSKEKVYEGHSLGCFSPGMWPRRPCIFLVESKRFDAVILATIMANCVTMAWESPLDPDTGSKADFIAVRAAAAPTPRPPLRQRLVRSVLARPIGAVTVGGAAAAQARAQRRGRRVTAGVRVVVPRHLHVRDGRQDPRVRPPPQQHRRVPARPVVPARLCRRLPRMAAHPAAWVRQLLGGARRACAAPAPCAQARAGHARARRLHPPVAPASRQRAAPLSLHLSRARHRAAAAPPPRCAAAAPPRRRAFARVQRARSTPCGSSAAGVSARAAERCCTQPRVVGVGCRNSRGREPVAPHAAEALLRGRCRASLLLPACIGVAHHAPAAPPARAPLRSSRSREWRPSRASCTTDVRWRDS
jgi:hypothetical protein